MNLQDTIVLWLSFLAIFGVWMTYFYETLMSPIITSILSVLLYMVYLSSQMSQEAKRK